MKTTKFTGDFVPEPFPPGFDKLSQEKQDAFYAKRAAARWAHEHPDAPAWSGNGAAQEKPVEAKVVKMAKPNEAPPIGEL